MHNSPFLGQLLHNSTKTSENNFRAVQCAPEIHGIPPLFRPSVLRCPGAMEIYCTVRLKVYATRQNGGRVSLQSTKKNMYMKLFICHLPACENIYAHTHTHAGTPSHTHTHTRRAEKLQIDVSKCGTKNGAKNFRVSFLSVLNEGPRPHPPSPLLKRLHTSAYNFTTSFKFKQHQ